MSEPESRFYTSQGLRLHYADWGNANAPLLLLDDVMSELDPDRRGRLAERIARHGQTVITTTDLAFVPGAEGPEVARVAVADGELRPDAAGARLEAA